MRQADLAGSGAQPAADQRRQRGRMVRVAKRPLTQQPAAAQPAGDRLDHAEFQRLGRFERRQDAGQPRRQHRFARAGRPDHQQIVAAGGGDFERAFRALLALDVLQVETGGARRRQFCLRRRQQLRALEVVDDRQQVRRRDDFDLAGPGGLAAARARADDSGVARRGRQRGDQDAGNRRQRAVERDLAERDVTGQLVLRQRPPFRRAARARSADRNGCLPLATSAGARLTVMRRGGRARPSADKAARTRSRDSATALSGRPTIVKAGSPAAIVTWVSTSTISTPRNATVRTRATIASA